MCKHSGFRPAPRDWRSLPPAFALIVLCSTPASAQVAGTISGYVHDQAGGVMPGVTVTAESAGQQRIRSTESNATGFFDLQALPRGIYVVKVEIAGFETQVRKDVEVTAGANVRLDFSLRVGGLAENVIVSGRATMVETRNATQSNLIDDQRVQDLPMNGRNVVALAGTYAGVTAIRASQDTSDGRQGPIMSVNGGNQNHNLFTLNAPSSRISTRRRDSIRRRPTPCRRFGFRPITSRRSTGIPRGVRSASCRKPGRMTSTEPPGSSIATPR